MFETRQLWHLVALDDHRHFGKASRTVGISQSALSKSIQRLEEEVGVRLIDRTRKQVAPTAVGEVVIQRARRILSHVEELKREVNLLLGRDTGALAVGIGPAMAESFASVAIARMAELHPKIHVLVRTDHWAQLSQWLFEGKLDLLVADISELRKDRRVNVIDLPTEQLVWFCRRGHPLASARRVTRKDLLAFPLATPKMPPWGIQWFAEVTRQSTEPSARESYGTVECESYSMLKRMVLASNCISAALRSTISAELESGDLVALPIKSPSIRTHAGIVTLLDRTVSPAVEAFISQLLKAAGKNDD